MGYESCMESSLIWLLLFSTSLVALSFFYCVFLNSKSVVMKFAIICNLIVMFVSFSLLQKISYSNQFLNQIKSHKVILVNYLLEKKEKYKYCTKEINKTESLDGMREILELTIDCKSNEYTPDKYWSNEEKDEYNKLVKMFDKKYELLLSKMK